MNFVTDEYMVKYIYSMRFCDGHWRKVKSLGVRPGEIGNEIEHGRLVRNITLLVATIVFSGFINSCLFYSTSPGSST